MKNAGQMELSSQAFLKKVKSHKVDLSGQMEIFIKVNLLTINLMVLASSHGRMDDIMKVNGLET